MGAAAVSFRSGRRALPRALVLLLPVLALLLGPVAGCAVPLSRYDATTYGNLTELKVEMTDLVASFDTESESAVDATIRAVDAKFRKALEYEKGKGEPNSDTMSQFEKIRGLFRDSVREFRENGPGALGDAYFTESATVLGQAFDVAIETENLKNRGTP